MPVCLVVGFFNNFFIDAAGETFKRRKYLMKQLTQMIEYNIWQKPNESAGLPVINFTDPSSLLAWQNMRTVLIDTGKKYHNRADFYMAFYGLLVAVNYVYMTCYGFGYLPEQFVLSLETLVVLEVYFSRATY